MKKAIDMGYRSHQTSTCGFHIHVSRDCLGSSIDEQEETISRILYFVESHWDELFRFSRRDEWSISRWAGRYGYEQHGRDILEKAKKREFGRYTAVNLDNKTTIEFRIFKGTLKYNTFIATLELVNAIIDIAVNRTEDELHRLTWEEFAAGITESELITYLKERGFYISEENQGAEVP